MRSSYAKHLTLPFAFLHPVSFVSCGGTSWYDLFKYTEHWCLTLGGVALKGIAHSEYCTRYVTPLVNPSCQPQPNVTLLDEVSGIDRLRRR